MTANPNAVHFQLSHHPYVAPGLSFPDNSGKFLGVFTATHLSLCLLVSGFGLIITGLLGVVTKASLDEKAFHAVGISLLFFGFVLIAIAVAIFVAAVRWGKKRVHTVRANGNYPPVSVMPVNYSYPVSSQVGGAIVNSETDATSPAVQPSYYLIHPSHNANAAAYPQHLIVLPSAPPSTPDQRNV